MSEPNNHLRHRGNDPGAVQYGNFINYYQFNAPENRLEVFPLEILDHLKNTTTKVFCLDIGCNAGVKKRLKNSVENVFIYNILGLNSKTTSDFRAKTKKRSFCIGYGYR